MCCGKQVGSQKKGGGRRDHAAGGVRPSPAVPGTFPRRDCKAAGSPLYGAVKNHPWRAAADIYRSGIWKKQAATWIVQDKADASDGAVFAGALCKTV